MDPVTTQQRRTLSLVLAGNRTVACKPKVSTVLTDPSRLKFKIKLRLIGRLGPEYSFWNIILITEVSAMFMFVVGVILGRWLWDLCPMNAGVGLLSLLFLYSPLIG